MSKNFLVQIAEMHEHFDLVPPVAPSHLSAEEKAFRVSCLLEEVREYEAATKLADELDAICDLLVFAIGTADRHGMLHVLPQAMVRVHEANMTKAVGAGKRGFSRDLVKPEGWTAPNHTDLVGDK